ncbi:ankyrin repeat domain-containing protein [Noviherbaspirillum pedocola]|nr:ankyrin repeat domain-containing protein [Noviherbaspirillum pedocola]
MSRPPRTRAPQHANASPFAQLFDAAERGDILELKRLVKQKSIDLHRPRPEDARTPLMVAISNGHETAALTLMDSATPEQLQQRDAQGCCALEMALDAGLEVAGRKLLSRLRNAKQSGGHAILLTTIAEGRDVRIWNLLKLMKNVNEKSEDGTTALAMAIQKGRVDLVKQLLNKGAFVEEKDAALDAPLSIAADKGSLDIVELLLERKADVHRAGKEGRTALHRAASAGHHEIVAALLDAKAKVDAVDRHGRTPLQYAGESGSDKCARLLIEHGADVHHADNEGITPLEVIDERDWVDAEVGDLTLQRAPANKCCAGCVIL